MITVLNVEHREHVSDRPFEEVLAAFDAATGSVEDGYGKVAGTAESPKDFQRVFSAREGSSGFMRFMMIDHGDWLTRFYGRPAKAVMIVLGNPLVAITMLQHDIRAGLNVPVRIYIYEDADHRTRVAYDVPSTLMGNVTTEARSAAAGLDAKLETLVAGISGTGLS